MGQQQIIILVLVVIIVGLGTILALQLLKTEYVEFMEDDYQQVLLNTAQSFKATYEKPEMFGGGGHHWNKVNFGNVGCDFGVVNDSSGKTCRSEDGNLIVLISGHDTYMGINAVVHIGGDGPSKMYSREVRVYSDSIAFVTDWIHHQ